MALSLISYPTDLEYIYNPSFYTLSSTNVNKNNFRYVAHLFVSRTGTTEDIFVQEFSFPPRPQNNYGVLSVNRVLQNYLLNDLSPAITTPATANGGVLIYKLYFGEQYSEVNTSGVTQYSGLTNVSGKIVLNALKNYEDSYNLNLYDGSYNSGTTAARYLTDWTGANLKRIDRNEYETLTVFASQPYQFDTLQIETFDFSGGTIGLFQIPFSGTEQYRFHVPVGTANLNYSSLNHYTSSPTSIMASNVYSYIISTLKSGVTINDQANYLIQTACTRYNPTRLCWKGRKGGWEYFTFKMYTRENINIKSTEWEKYLGYGSQVGDRGRSVLYSDSKTRLTITSDWITAAEADYLKDSLLNSHPYPDVYIIGSSGIKLPVILTDSSFEIKTLEQDRLISYTINLEYAYDK